MKMISIFSDTKKCKFPFPIYIFFPVSSIYCIKYVCFVHFLINIAKTFQLQDMLHKLLNPWELTLLSYIFLIKIRKKKKLHQRICTIKKKRYVTTSYVILKPHPFFYTPLTLCICNVPIKTLSQRLVKDIL